MWQSWIRSLSTQTQKLSSNVLYLIVVVVLGGGWLLLQVSEDILSTLATYTYGGLSFGGVVCDWPAFGGAGPGAGPALFSPGSQPLKASKNWAHSRRRLNYFKIITLYETLYTEEIQSAEPANVYHSDVHLPANRINRSEIENQCHTAEETHPEAFGLLSRLATPLLPAESGTNVVVRGLSNPGALAW